MIQCTRFPLKARKKASKAMCFWKQCPLTLTDIIYEYLLFKIIVRTTTFSLNEYYGDGRIRKFWGEKNQSVQFDTTRGKRETCSMLRWEKSVTLLK